MTTYGKDVESLREAFRGLSRGAAPRGDCPTGELLWEALHGRLTPDRRRDVVDHLAACPACAELWRVGMEAGARPPLVAMEGGPAGEEPSPSWGRWGALAAAIGVVAVLSVTVPLLITRPPEVSTFRDAGPQGTRSLLPEDTPVSADELVLRWSAGPAGSLYDVAVATEELEVLHRATGLADPWYAVPSEALVGLAPGTRLLWRVEVIRPDGTRSGSPTFVNTLE